MTPKICCIKLLSRQQKDVLPTVEAEVASHYHNVLRFFPKEEKVHLPSFIAMIAHHPIDLIKKWHLIYYSYIYIEILLHRFVLISNLFSIFYTTVRLGPIMMRIK